MPETRCVHYVLYLRVYFDYKRTWLCQEHTVRTKIEIYFKQKKNQIEPFISIHVSSKDHHIYHT
jgi:hypothetical protein